MKKEKVKENSKKDITSKKETSSAMMTAQELASYIDHTLLKPGATEEQFVKLCEEAKYHKFKSVCVNSFWVPFVSKQLKGTSVKTCSVIGFPLGAIDTESKAFEAKNAIANGAQELDMVINIGALKSGKSDVVEEDIRAVRHVCGNTTLLKVIIETSELSEEEKVQACEIAKKAQADFVKTSTGFSSNGATVEDIALMRRVVGPKMGVKASGGIRDFKTAVAMIQAGATRIGAGGGVAIVSGAQSNDKY